MLNRTLRLIAATLLLTGCALRAQAEFAGPPPETAPIPSTTLSLLDASRLTLSHQAGIRLREQEAAFGGGVLLEESGRFDTTLLGDLSYSFDKHELRASQKKAERDKRDSLAKGIAEQQGNLSETERIRSEIEARRNGDESSPIEDPELEAALDLIDAAIENASKPETIERLRELRGRTIDTALAKYDDAIGELKASISEDQAHLKALGRVPDAEEITTGRSLIQLVFPLRNGVTIAPFYQYTLDGDRYTGKPIDEQHGGKGIQDAYRSSLGFNLYVPLSRGSGTVSADAREAAAKAEYDARLALAAHSAASSLTDTGLAYWEATAAAEELKILAASAESQARLVELTKTLAQAEELPAFELDRAEAQWASARAALDEGRRAELSARVALARVVGLNLLDAVPPHPSDSLPDLKNLSLKNLEGLPFPYDEILSHREDLRAARAFVAAADVRVRAAEHDLRPRIDLSTRAFVNDFSESSAGKSFTGRWLGPSYDVKLSAEKPIGNRTQKGLLAQAEADEALRMIDLKEQERLIVLSIVELAGGFRSALAEDLAAQKAAEGYRQAYDAEIEKLRLGESTLVDVLLTEQRWTEARLAAIASRRDAAKILIQLRFSTGTLFAGTGEARQLAADAFTALPLVLTDAGPGGHQ